MRTSDFSVANSRSASALTSSVLPTPVGPRNRKRPERAVALGQSDAGAADGVGDQLDGLLLADHAAVEVLLEGVQALELAGDQLADRDARAGSHDRGDVGLADDHAARRRGVGRIGLAGLAVRAVELRQTGVELVRADLQLGRALVLLGGDGGVLLGVELRELAAQRLEVRAGRPGAQAHLRGGLVDQVDRLVRQLVLADVAVGQPRGGDERLVGDRRLVVALVRAAQAAQDLDGVLHRRLLDRDRREAPRERAVTLDPAVLGQRGRADDAHLAAGEHGLEHVGGVHRALGVARAEDRVELVDEQQDPALGGDGLLERGLQPLLELAAVLGAGEHAGEVDGHDAHAAERRGHVALDDAAGEALDDRGLADAGLTDEDGVVLAAAGEDLDGLLDLLLAPDDGVDAALAGVGRQVAAELVQGRGPALRLVAVGLGVGRRHRGAPGRELARARLAHRDLGRAALGGDDHAQRARPSAADRTDGGTRTREALGDVRHVGSLARRKKSQSRRLKFTPCMQGSCDGGHTPTGRC